MISTVICHATGKAEADLDTSCVTVEGQEYHIEQPEDMAHLIPLLYSDVEAYIAATHLAIYLLESTTVVREAHEIASNARERTQERRPLLTRAVEYLRGKRRRSEP